MSFTGIRCTMIFDEEGSSFSETYSIDSTDFAVVKPAFVSLFKARAKLCGPPVTAAEGRMTLVNAGKANRTYELLDNVSIESISVPAGMMQTAFRGQQSNTADRAQACVQVIFQAGQRHHRNGYLAGVPDELIGMNPVLIPNHVSPTWQALFDSWKALLVGTPRWGYDGRFKLGDAVAPVQRTVTGLINRLADGLLGVQYTPGGLSLPAGSKACLRNFIMSNRAYLSPNGIWKVAETVVDSPVAGTNTTYLRGSENVFAGNVTDFGTIEDVLDGFIGFTDVIIKRQANRKRGKSFGGTPGRRTIRHKI